MTENKRLKVMFLCAANSCRSQMAEGFARELGEDVIAPYSAGSMSWHVHPLAIQVMKESGIDISHQQSKAIDKDVLKDMNLIISLCGEASELCPSTPRKIKRINMPVHDPVSTIGTEEEIMNAFRKARDEIKGKVLDLIINLKNN